jgi:hypothetical protein
MTRRQFSARAWIGALACSVVMVTAGATTAGATATSGHPAPIRARITTTAPDPTCPPNVEYPGDTGTRDRIVGPTWTRFGPSRLDVSICRIFVGAIGGEQLLGSFVLRTPFGSLRGTAEGTVGFGATDHYTVTLTVRWGTWFLTHTRGTLTLEGDAGGDVPGFTGTLTSSLYHRR